MVAGRKPTTPEEHRRRGNTAGTMPILVGGRVSPPEPPHLTPHMKACWDYIVVDLAKGSMLDHADAGIIEAAAVFWGTARDARMRRLQEVEESAGVRDGLTETTPQGRVENRLLAIERNSWKEFRAIADQLPLSPWGRARLGLKARPQPGAIEADIGPSPRALHIVGTESG